MASFRSIRRLWLLPIAAMLLAGCASLAPEYVRPTAPVPAQFASETATQASAVNAPALAWRDYFINPELQGLIEQALANNRDLRLAVLRVEEARASYRISRSDLAPTIGVAAEGTRSRTPADLSLTGQPLLSSQYQAGAGVTSWELDFWGRIRSMNEAALQTFFSTDEAWRASTLLLVSQVADAYLGVRELDERIRLANQALATRTESRRVFARRLQVGSASKLDFTQADLLQQQAQVLVQQLQLQRSTQLHALGVLVGDPGLQLPPAGKPLSALAPMRELAPGLPSELLENRPDIVAAEHSLQAAKAQIGAARAMFFPSIALTGFGGTASNELSGLFGSGNGAWTFSPGISLPIFDGGRRRANLKLTEVQRDAAVAQYEATIQNAFRDVADALSSRQWLAEQLKTLRATEATQGERARLATRRFNAGAARYFEVLDAERDLLTTQQQVVQADHALLTAQLRLYTALGGGSQALPHDPVRAAANAD